MPIYNPPIITSTTSQYQLTASFLSSSITNSTSSISINTLGTDNKIYLQPQTTISPKGATLYIAAGSGSTSQGDLYLITQDSNGTQIGRPAGDIYIVPGIGTTGTQHTNSGSIFLNSIESVIGVDGTGSSGYLRVYSPRHNFDLSRADLYATVTTINSSIQTYIDSDLVVNVTSPYFRIQGFLDADTVTECNFSYYVGSEHMSSSIRQKNPAIGTILLNNNIFLVHTASNITASEIAYAIDNEGYASTYSKIEIYNTKNKILLKHSGSYVDGAPIILSGGVDRHLDTNQSIRFMYSGSRYYEIYN
jgi:hypothetical protein